MATEADDLPDSVEALKQLVRAQRAEVEHLQLIIAKLKRMQFGRRSEKLEREVEQLQLRHPLRTRPSHQRIEALFPCVGS